MTKTTPNVDQAEIGKFEKLAARWWDPNSEFKPLHDINPLRLDYIDRAAVLDGKEVLDVGCGGGILSEGMAIRGAKVTGIDMGEKPLQVAELHTLESGVSVTYRRVPVEGLAAESPTRFDVVTCMEMLEHVPEPASVVMACARLVKPGGFVFFSTLNRNLKSYLLAIIGAEYIRHVAAGHPRLRAFHQTLGAGHLGPGRGAAYPGHHRHDLQPPDRYLPPYRPGSGRQLPDDLPPRIGLSNRRTDPVALIYPQMTRIFTE